LRKDYFLRKRMDVEGCLPVSLIASFNRVQYLTQDVAFIIKAVRDSDIVEVKDGVKVREAPTPWHFKLVFSPLQFRPKTRPTSWPLPADGDSPPPHKAQPQARQQQESKNDLTARLNPYVPEFIPTTATDADGSAMKSKSPPRVGAENWVQVKRRSKGEERRSLGKDDQPQASSSLRDDDASKEELEFNFDEDLDIPMGRQNRFSAM